LVRELYQKCSLLTAVEAPENKPLSMLILHNKERFDVQIDRQIERNPWAEAFCISPKDLHSP
jgi:hypothetical protein